MEKIMICQSCGKECERTSNVQKYCEECRIKKQVERNSAYRKRKEDGTVSGLGTKAVCPACGSTFEKNSGNQNLCSDCVRKGVTLKQRKLSELPENEKHEIYLKNTQIQNKLYDRISVYIPKGKKEQLQELSNAFEMSLNSFVNQAIELYEQQLRSELETNKK